MNLQGIFPPIATPFVNDEVDFRGLQSNIERWMKTPLSGLLVLGSNGEAPLLDDDEARRVVEAAREVVPRDKTMIVGASGQSTHSAIGAVRRAAQAGADVVLVQTPSYFKSLMNADVFVRHFTAVADASPVPVLPYNVPVYTGVVLPAVAVAKLSAHPNIVGVKDSSGDLTQIGDLVALTPPAFKVLVGSAPTLYASLCVGASGGIVAVACVMPELCVRLYELAREGQHAEALALQRQITPLAKSVTGVYGVAGLKAAMELAGYVGGAPRAPLAPASAEAIAVIRAQIEALQAAVA